MRSKKSIAIVALVVLLISILAVSLVGCKTQLDNKEAFDSLQGAIANSKIQKTYYVKENKYSTIKLNDTTEYRMNIHEDDAETAINDTKALYSKSYTEAVSMSVNKFEQWTFGPSLSKDIKPSKAKDEDYKYFMFNRLDENDESILTRKPMTMEEYFELPEIKNYMIANVLSGIEVLDFDSMRELVASKMGVTTTLSFVVNKEGHAYHTKQVRVQFLYNKVSLIEVREKGAPDTKISSKIDITYMGPKIHVLNWDSKDITEA